MQRELLLQILNDTYELIKDDSHWIRGCAARNAHEQEVDPISSDACRWCLSGALTKIMSTAIVARYSQEACFSLSSVHTIVMPVWGRQIGNTLKPVMGDDITVFNDFNTHAIVIDALKIVINQVEQRGQ